MENKQLETLSKSNDFYLELWNQARLGSREAYAQLCESHYRTLFNYGLNLTKDRELVKDVIQDLFLYLWEKRNVIGEINVMTIYLIRATRNNLISQLRKNQWNVLYDNFDSEDELTDEQTIESSLIEYERYSQNEQRMRKAIELLPKRQREVLFLKFYQGVSNTDIANLMNINNQSVSNHLQKALITLRALFPNHWKKLF
ncbi:MULTISPECIES: RNA polymerase sigma factor [Arcicella]|uniref:Sigma-70 family RNA polymerase sigma factor n=1 Tax=Arcicella lustrica TaxID=2984196 RepID=A0ABU5SJ61_9BACT|nr:sigma-70 family RNA polymerase sigma factor [Arcicella sp. DC25W]MEA5427274.1 sigma-70 family RNA polymerase sigma factor [Arcicella sp. DC25W]